MLSIHNNNQSRIIRDSVSGAVALIALAVYWITADHSVSYWDCPEYATCASRLEIGHPPGNPFWMLAMRVATAPFPQESHALVINLFSGVFMALAAFLLSNIIFTFVKWCADSISRNNRLFSADTDIIAAITAAGGALCFAFCDSTWFSAVESEVYAMSTFLSALTVWIMILWAKAPDPSRQKRLLILNAYILGLSIGVHQLNLLCIPVFALIYVFRRHPEKGQTLRAWCAVFVSFVIVGLILFSTTQWMIAAAAWCELIAVNSLGLPYFSGVYIFILTVVLLLVIAIIVTGKSFPRLNTAIWMVAFIILGFSSFALILIRGYAAPPMNQGAPADIFAFQRYVAREQYGSRPLIYGQTPYSTPMLREDFKPGQDLPVYTKYILKKKGAQYVPAIPDARINPRSGFLTKNDSDANSRIISEQKHGYILRDYSFSQITSPELDMWLPRITGSDPGLLKSYESWAGMDRESMTRVEISETIDSLGNPAGKIGADGKRHKPVSFRPTYLQNLRMMGAYQVYYMYFRYLLWNFAGRQNDIPSTGEIDHGNFITGFSVIDDAMLGLQDRMPESASFDNPGRNVYYCIPFILGIIGICYLSFSGRRGRRTLAVTTMFFLMTGLAIVVYLNQTPGEPRERDYSFIGSYMAFSIWIAFGMLALGEAVGRVTRSYKGTLTATVIAAAGIPLLMACRNFDDHNRALRSEPVSFASNILSSTPEGIIFTQGDNFTFPLWYAQETEGIGKGHAVIDLSYLSTPEYVVNLMKQWHPALSFTASPADVAFGAYAFTRISPEADTVPIPLIEALRELYSQKSGAPVLQHSKVIIPAYTKTDSLIIDLRKEFGGNMKFRHLMLLDIIATNLQKENPVPLYFLTSISGSFHHFLSDALRPLPYSDVYAPAADSVSYQKMLLESANGISGNRDSRLPDYIEPVVEDQYRRQRGRS